MWRVFLFDPKPIYHIPSVLALGVFMRIHDSPELTNFESALPSHHENYSSSANVPMA